MVKLRNSFQMFILTNVKFVARTEGDGYNSKSKNNNLERVTDMSFNVTVCDVKQTSVGCK